MSNQLPVAAPTKLTPGELPLTLTADVLRLPYPLATRVVLAEIVSLDAATGNCYCSDAHLAARLTIAKDTASVAVKLLVADGLVTKQVDKTAGNIRHLAPVPAAIAIKAASNPYPEIPGSPTRNLPVALPGNSGTNTTVNSTEILQESHTLPELEKKIGAGEFSEDSTPSLTAEAQIVPPVAEPPQPAPAKPLVEEQGPQHSEASKALARKMASLWHITEQGNTRKWMQLARFTHYMEQADRLAEISRQFAGYALYLEKRRIQPYNLDKYLGSEGNGYDGEWCGCDWQAKGAAARADGDNSPAPPPKRANFGPSRSKDIIW